MIYITGDCHREFSRFNTKNFPDQHKMTKADYVIRKTGRRPHMKSSIPLRMNAVSL